jgi:hypothetical protein
VTVSFQLRERFGSFLADGDSAARFRFTEVEQAISKGNHVALDFDGVTNMTDSFGNALIGTLVELHPALLQGRIEFKNCNPVLRELVAERCASAGSSLNSGWAKGKFAAPALEGA